MRDYPKTIISQYSDSTRLVQLIEDLNNYLDPEANLEAFWDNIWNILTATGYGLDVWGRIVGVTRVIQISAGKFLGFEEGGSVSYDPFGQSPLYSGQPLTSNYSLTDDTFRRLIFAKAASNITDCSIPALNKILMNLFPGRGNAFVAEGANAPTFAHFGFKEAGDAVGFQQAPFGDAFPSRPGGMMMTYVFQFALAPFEVGMVTTSGVLPKPVGVLAGFQYLTQ